MRRNRYIIESKVALRLQLESPELVYRGALAKLRHQTKVLEIARSVGASMEWIN
jgi:hypothetical protein